jgi:hypothetical protein
MASDIDIIKRLLIRTFNGQIEWEIADGGESSVQSAIEEDATTIDYDFEDDDAFVLELPSGAITLHLDPDEDIVLTLLDAEDEVLAQFNAGMPDQSELRSTIQSLYDVVRKKATGIESRLDDLLGDIG